MRRLFALLLICLVLAPAVVQAQGLLVVVDPNQSVRLPRPIIIWPPYPPYPPYPPHPPRPIPHPRPTPPPATYKIQEIDVQVRLTDQVAGVQVSQTFVNTGSRQLEVAFIFPLPYDGAIDELTLMVDGKEYPAQLLEADEARRTFEAIVRKNKDPALLEWMGSGMFKTSVFPVPPGAKRTVSLHYTQLCRMQDGLTDFLFPMSTAKYTSHAVEKVNVRLTIDSHEELRNIYSPTHDVKVKRSGKRNATVTYSSENEVPSSDFRLFFGVGRGAVSTRVLSYRPDRDKEGYFLLLATPRIEADDETEKAKKTVFFVLDRSGSMSGKKIEQARAAAKFVLENLREGDLFNVIAYDSDVESFRPELQRFNKNTRREGLDFIEGIYAGGSTNIDGAMRAALSQLQDSDRPNYVLFLTDGLPTAGVTNEMEIVDRAREANKVRARVFSFGVGFDVNSRLLDKLARECFGQSEYVRPDEDIEDRVSRLYRRIESPVMTDVELEFVLDEARGGRTTNRVYPKGSFDLFAGEQLVMVGRYKKSGAAEVVVTGRVGGQRQKVEFPAKLVKHSDDDTFGFIEKLWAVRRIGEIIDELDLQGKNEELVEELVKLSTRHGILTPYTSFLADENTPLGDLAANRRQTNERLFALEAADGLEGFAQRHYKGSLQRAARAPAPALGVPISEAFRDSSGRGHYGGAAPGGFGMGGQAGGGRGGGPAAGPVARQLREADEELSQAGQTVRTIGTRAFYLRGAQWEDSTLTETQKKDATRVKQFSDAYFALARRHGRELSQYLVFDEAVLLNVADRAYLIEP